MSIELAGAGTMDRLPPSGHGSFLRVMPGEAGADIISRDLPVDMTVFDAVLAAARKHGWGRMAVEDQMTGGLTYRRLLMGAHVLGRRIAPLAGLGRPIGIMLPNANGAALTLLAVWSAGQLPVMINFTAGIASLQAACRTAGVEVILTARAFIAKAKLEHLVAALQEKVAFVYLEDLRATIGTLDKARALVAHRRPLVGRLPGDAAVILFTSGSEGMPKGVVLTHRNLLANIAMSVARVEFGPGDKIFNVLPVFHAFGLTAGLLLGLVCGLPVYLYPSPLHSKIVPELFFKSKSTVLFGTDTFLAGYAHSAEPHAFGAVRYVVAGAEPVKERTRALWREKFGVELMEGYGVTETAPVLALNTPAFSKAGSVGRLLPGIEARLEPVAGIDDGGRLMVRGANVMLGYLNADDPGLVEPPKDGWHDTGDIVAIDAEGFVTILGRAKRFAKIGGEMISLAAIEAVTADLWPEAQCAAAIAPDPRRGERIILLTDNQTATGAAFHAFARERGLSDLAMPAEIMIIDQIPLLGSGKVDHPSVTVMLRERLLARAEALAS